MLVETEDMNIKGLKKKKEAFINAQDNIIDYIK